MRKVPDQLWPVFTKTIQAAGVELQDHAAYRRWLHFYLDFCGKYGRPLVEQYHK